ncbi:RodZ domain-containing protein [Marinivivus vitaminiproducens]|uniref:RodZ domain-containing protein n=1 Tax=Marinivivus vitaminiproducens TaxID=3035935 RepID=UPI0027AABCEA|nr:DUF4115 domain-containing protein [Geminicoccaceae bacterium SCSIO 64248]
MFRARTPADIADTPDQTLAEIGQRLRAAREAAGRPVDVYADSLCIRTAYLDALESGDLALLPGRVYALGFLRSYAGLLGLDAEALVRDARREIARRRLWPHEAGVTAPTGMGGRLPGMAVATALSLLLLAGGAAFWTYGRVDAPPPAPAPIPVPSVSQGAPAPMASVEPDSVLAPADMVQPSSPVAAPGGDVASVSEPGMEQPPATGLPAPAPPSASGTPSASAGLDLAGPELAGRPPAVDEPPSSAEPGATDAAEPPVATAVGVPGAPQATEMTGRIVLEAREPSWIQVRSPSRDFVHSGTLEAGDRFVVPDRTDLALWTGNAGGLVVLVDGKPLPPLGTSGAVLRDVSLDPARLEGRVRATP